MGEQFGTLTINLFENDLPPAPVVPGARRFPADACVSRNCVVILGVFASLNLLAWKALYSAFNTGDIEHSCRTVPAKAVRSVRVSNSSCL